MVEMEIALVGPTSIKIKGKLAAFVVDPEASKTKVAADAILLLAGSLDKVPEVEGARLTLSGPGEYEIGGMKISGVKNGERATFYISVDGMSLLIAPVSSIKGKESLRDVDVAVLLADTLVDASALASVTNGVSIFYGPQAEENVKALGKEVPATGKYVITKDKLPQEMEVVLLG